MRTRRKPGAIHLHNTVKLLLLIITISFIITQLISSLHLKPKTHLPNPKPTSKIGRHGKTLIRMLPSDLAFTLFLPSEPAFRRVLRLDRSNGSSDEYAVLTRVLGFSAVPRWISAADLEKEREYDSISGMKVYVWRNGEGKVVVNGVVACSEGMRVGSVLVHVVDGVVMDAEFEQALLLQPDDEEG